MKQSIAKVLSIVLICNAISSTAQIQAPPTPQFKNFDNSTAANTSPSHPYGGAITGATSQSISSQQQNAQAVALMKKQQEVAQLMRDVQASNSSQYALRMPQRIQADTSHMRGFENALQYLKAMLAGKLPLSVADAYFVVETAYGKPYLTKAEFDKILSQSVPLPAVLPIQVHFVPVAR